MNRNPHIAVVGATGAVGIEMIRTLEKRNFPVGKLTLLASARSSGKQLTFKGQPITVQTLTQDSFAGIDIALFSAGGDISRDFAPAAVKAGCVVIDNSSAFRMNPEVPLVVPEINAGELTAADKIIANPNCSTIQMVLALAPLHKKYNIKRIIVSTYQSITGTGVKAVEQLNNEAQGKKGMMAYPYPIHKNAIPHCDIFLENDYTKEEMKLVHETHKILGDDTMGITATAIRIPVLGGHSEAVNIEFENPFEISDIRKLLNNTQGIVVQDNPETNTYPMPIYAEGKDDIFIGRIRRDTSHPNAVNLWIVADNLRKGAATNTVQIAEYLIANVL